MKRSDSQTTTSWQSLGQLLLDRASGDPGSGIYVRGERGVQEFRTLSQWKGTSLRVAAGLRERGVRPGTRVLVEATTGFAFLEAFFGVLMLGAVPVPVRLSTSGSPWRRMTHWRRLSERFDAPYVIVDDGSAGAVSQWIRHPIRAVESVRRLTQGRALPSETSVSSRGGDDVAYIQLTSGAEGPPKGVALSHAAIAHSVQAIGRRIEVNKEDVIVSWLPLDNIMGLLGVVIFALHWGIRPVLMKAECFLESPEDWFWTIADHRATLSLAPNFAFNYCVRRCNEKRLEGLDLSSWRIAMNGAEPVRAQHIQSFIKRFHRYGLSDRVVMPVYGLSEATLGVSFYDAEEVIAIDGINRRRLEMDGIAKALPEEGAQSVEERMHVVSVGRPLEGMEVQIRGKCGTPLEDRRLGEITIRGPQLMKGYVGDGRHGGGEVDEAGWLATGDMGYWVDGQLYFVGRRADMIELASGRRVIPEEVELFVDAVDGVRAGSSACFPLGSTREAGGPTVVVVFERQPGAKKGRLERQVGSVLEEHLQLTEVEIQALPLRSVPKTATGKVQRQRCRTWWRDGKLGEEEPPLVDSEIWKQQAKLWGESARAGGATLIDGIRKKLEGY